MAISPVRLKKHISWKRLTSITIWKCCIIYIVHNFTARPLQTSFITASTLQWLCSYKLVPLPVDSTDEKCPEVWHYKHHSSTDVEDNDDKPQRHISNQNQHMSCKLNKKLLPSIYNMKIPHKSGTCQQQQQQQSL